MRTGSEMQPGGTRCCNARRYGPFVSTSRLEFLAALPRKVVGAGALVTDDLDQVLVVKPTYKPGWEIPGGCVEHGESAREACGRELTEELGLTVAVSRLLVIEHQTRPDDKGDSIMFVYDGGSLTTSEDLTLPADELAEARFVSPLLLAELLPLRLARRMEAAIRARQEETVIELVNGEVHPG